MACKYFDKCEYMFKEKYCSGFKPVWMGCGAYIRFEEEKNYNPYWENVCAIAKKQRKKGIETYGQGVEDNHLDIEKRLQYLEEELVDALMYLEWCKDYLSKQSSLEKSNVKECNENGT